MMYIDIDNSDDKILINDTLSDKKFNHNNLIIIDNDLDKVKKYYNPRKNIIIYNKKKNKLNDSIYYKDNVFAFTHLEELNTIIDVINIRRKNSITLSKVVTAVLMLTAILVTAFTGPKLLKDVNKNIPTSTKTDVVAKEIVEEEKEITDYSKENFIFYGDSITQCYDIEHFYPDLPVVNTAHWGYLTPTLLDEVEERVLAYNPTKVFLLMGTNDLGYSDSTDEEIFENIKKVVQIIKKDRKNVKIYIQSIYPVNETIDIDANVWHIRENARIRNINSMLEEYCKEQKLTYIDVYSALQEEDGSIKEEYTVEGLHITYDGYKKITEVLDKYVREAY
ncbi:MAG: GDSL-type esterase/lipase family protein [Bacilli bacterium]|nr:GDSL-type esterase/lipase family protein [Bacilli bacterium]